MVLIETFAWTADAGPVSAQAVRILADEIALVIDTGRRIHPTITPDDPDTVERILIDHRAR
jgi:hypothetical protein